MDAFISVLRQQVLDSEQALLTAERCADQAAMSMHRARLLDLLDRAAANNVDTTAWITVELRTASAGGWR